MFCQLVVSKVLGHPCSIRRGRATWDQPQNVPGGGHTKKGTRYHGRGPSICPDLPSRCHTGLPHHSNHTPLTRPLTHLPTPSAAAAAAPLLGACLDSSRSLMFHISRDGVWVWESGLPQSARSQDAGGHGSIGAAWTTKRPLSFLARLWFARHMQEDLQSPMRRDLVRTFVPARPGLLVGGEMEGGGDSEPTAIHTQAVRASDFRSSPTPHVWHRARLPLNVNL